jgi:soluble lytic murein transglycosylase-like protein
VLRLFGVSLAVGIVGLSVAGPAAAQIYTWRDANGVLVLSDRPQGNGGREAVAATALQTPSSSQMVTVDSIRNRRTPYDDLIREQAALNSVRPALVHAMIQVESAFDPTAVSPKGAMGLMQLMPATAATFGVGNPFNPRENVRAGVAYLRQLLDRYGEDEGLALAAYNAGPGAVDRYGQAVPPYRETRNYVSKINDMARPTTRASGTTIYRSVEIVDGLEVVKYSDRP